MPCWPRCCFMTWNLEPYSSLAKILGICLRTMPGPLSSMMMRNLVSPSWTNSILISGNILASSQASRELSTASFTVVSSAFLGLSKPSRWRFFSKNSAMEISRCFVASSSAVLVFISAMPEKKKKRFKRVAVTYFSSTAFKGSLPKQHLFLLPFQKLIHGFMHRAG